MKMALPTMPIGSVGSEQKANKLIGSEQKANKLPQRTIRSTAGTILVTAPRCSSRSAVGSFRVSAKCSIAYHQLNQRRFISRKCLLKTTQIVDLYTWTVKRGLTNKFNAESLDPTLMVLKFSRTTKLD